MVKTKWNDPLEDDSFIDAAAAADNLREDPHYGQDSGLPEESRKASKEDESSSSSNDEPEDTRTSEEAPLGHIWTTHDNWRVRLNNLTPAQEKGPGVREGTPACIWPCRARLRE